jgi:hypothetical protein
MVVKTDGTSVPTTLMPVLPMAASAAASSVTALTTPTALARTSAARRLHRLVVETTAVILALHAAATTMDAAILVITAATIPSVDVALTVQLVRSEATPARLAVAPVEAALEVEVEEALVAPLSRQRLLPPLSRLPLPLHLRQPSTPRQLPVRRALLRLRARPRSHLSALAEPLLAVAPDWVAALVVLHITLPLCRLGKPLVLQRSLACLSSAESSTFSERPCRKRTLADFFPFVTHY